ncbi:MAG: large subunit ribosomal protein L3 [Chloroflexi bacterium]|jgi:large subunit ribosomal protein L3|nr:MAG: large subunit ribosomal protein L3 [Chloroflexota bacterium]
MVNGIIGKKIGMTRIFREDGTVSAVSVIEAGPCTVTDIKTKKRDGYEAVQLGYGETHRLTNPEKGHLRASGSQARHLREFPLDEALEVGQKITVDIFQPGERVDVIANSKGKGFAGVVKRHHFKGGPKTHGQGDRHRAPGSIGAGTFPGRVIKGMKMAGHMGNARTTVQNLEVVQADLERNLLFVKGPVPGARNTLVMIRRSNKSLR